MGLLFTSYKQGLTSNSDTTATATATAAAADELIAIDAEHNFSYLNLADLSNTSNSSSESSSKLKLTRTIVGHNDEILDLKILPIAATSTTTTPDQGTNNASPTRKIAVATNCAQIRLFTLGTFSCTVLSGHTEIILSLSTSPCGRYLASAGKDRTVRLWSTATDESEPSSSSSSSLTGRCLATAVGHAEAVASVALSQRAAGYDIDGKAATNGAGAFLVSVASDRTFKRWNLPGSRVLLGGRDENGDGNHDGGEDGDGNCLQLDVFVSARAHEKVCMVLECPILL